MNSRERLMAVLTGKEPDRLPWAPLIDYYFTNSLPEQGLNMNEIEAVRYIGGDILLRHVNIFKEKRGNVWFKIYHNGNEELLVYETPVGKVQSRYKYSGKTRYMEEALIKTIEDVKIMQYIAEDVEYEPDFMNFHDMDKAIGDDGIATPSTPTSPIQDLLQHKMGIEKFTYFMYDYPDEMKEYMQVLHSCNIKVHKLMAESPDSMKVFIDYEDTSTTVLSPEWYKIYSKNCIDEYADIMHSGEKIFITHMCGKLKGMVGELVDGRMDGIDSVCPPSTGDLWVHEALKLIPGKIIIGGIEPPALKQMTVEETKAYVRKVVFSCAPYKGFILSTGDATSYGTPIQNLMAVTEVVEEINI